MRRKTWPWRLLLLSFAGLVLLTLLLLIADFAGVPKAVVNGIFLVASIIGYALIGMFCRTTVPEEYFVAGRRVSAPMNGMATAADWLSAASFIGLTGLLLSDGFVGDGQHPGGLAYLLGWTGGFCLLGFLFAAKLNLSRAITIPDFLGRRFDSAAVRWLAAWGAILCSSVYLVAQIYGIGLVASMLSGLTFELGVFLALGGVLLCSFLGGMRAVTWTQGVQCGFRCRAWSVGLGIGGGGRVGAEGQRAVGGGGRRVEGGGRRVDRGRRRVEGEAVGDGRRGWEVGEMRVAVASSAILRCLRRGHVGQ